MKRSRKFLLEQRLHGRALKKGKNMGLDLNQWVSIGTLVTAIGTIAAIIVGIVTINSAKKSFAVQNRPFLQVGNFKVNKNFFQYSIYNLNQYPAKIIYVYQGFSKENIFDNNNNWIRIFKNRQVFRPPRNRAASNLENVYVTKGDLVNTSQYDPLFDRIEENLFFFGGKIYYVDQITDKIRVYQFVIQLSGKTDDLNRIFLENENKFFDNENSPTGVKPNGYY